MTLFTEVVLNALHATGPVEFFNTSVGANRRTPMIRLRYVFRAIGSAMRLLAGGQAHGRRLYLVANSQAGLYFTLMLVTVAKRMGYSIYLHHHVYSYINRRDWRMARIDRTMSSTGVHVVHCEKMARDFSAKYAAVNRFAFVYPSAVSIGVQSARALTNSSIRLGMLSNLTLSKGVGRAIETLRALRDDGRSVTLHLAGPLQDQAAKQLLQQAMEEFPEAVYYHGPVYGGDKTRFLSKVDVFLFPTEYDNESWGIVLNEAMAAGIPVITNDRGCSRIVFGERSGRLVEDAAQFVPEAVQQIDQWLDSPTEYAAASRAALDQAERLNRIGETSLSEFATHMFSTIGCTDTLYRLH